MNSFSEKLDRLREFPHRARERLGSLHPAEKIADGILVLSYLSLLTNYLFIKNEEWMRPLIFSVFASMGQVILANLLAKSQKD